MKVSLPWLETWHMLCFTETQAVHYGAHALEQVLCGRAVAFRTPLRPCRISGEGACVMGRRRRLTAAGRRPGVVIGAADCCDTTALLPVPMLLAWLLAAVIAVDAGAARCVAGRRKRASICTCRHAAVLQTCSVPVHIESLDGVSQQVAQQRRNAPQSIDCKSSRDGW